MDRLPLWMLTGCGKGPRAEPPNDFH